MRRVHVVDSHTEGEPTRLVVAGGPELGLGSMEARRERFRQAHDAFRRAILSEPRGSPAMVGAVLLPPEDPAHTAGLVFFNNVGFLGMCGHGTIGVVESLRYLGRLGAGRHRFETPAGVVEAELRPDGRVRVANVPCYRHRASVPVDVPGVGRVEGDVAWGGNWFFLSGRAPCPLRPEFVGRLTDHAEAIRAALAPSGVTGAHGATIDHIELEGPAERPENHGRNFVLCPGGMYDRSPCGTGTSAKMACLYADGRLRPGEVWRQEGILGGVFEGSVELSGSELRPRITGAAFVTGDGELLLDDRDPFVGGIPG